MAYCDWSKFYLVRGEKVKEYEGKHPLKKILKDFEEKGVTCELFWEFTDPNGESSFDLKIKLVNGKKHSESLEDPAFIMIDRIGLMKYEKWYSYGTIQKTRDTKITYDDLD